MAPGLSDRIFRTFLYIPPAAPKILTNSVSDELYISANTDNWHNISDKAAKLQALIRFDFAKNMLKYQHGNARTE